MTISILGFGTGKNGCSVVGIDDKGAGLYSERCGGKRCRSCRQDASLYHSHGRV